MKKLLRSLGRFMRWCCVPVFVVTLLVAIRTAWMGTHDTFRFGRGDTWYGYIHVSIGRLNAGGEMHTPAYARYDKGRGWFLEHHIGNSGNAAWRIDPGLEFRPLRDWGFFQSGQDLLGGTEVRHYYWLRLGPLPAILLLTSLCILAAWSVPTIRAIRSRRDHRKGLCPKCHYDLRAHKPGDRCPECGNVIPLPLRASP